MRSVRALPAPRLGQRTLALFIALALQISFLLLLAQAVLKPSRAVRQLARELTLTLPRLPAARPAPSSSAQGIPSRVRPEVPPPVSLSPPVSAVPIVPPSALQGFGRALNNCAPQDYANLPEDQKALCTRPGQGVAVQSAPNLMGVPSAVKDEAHWQAELARKQSPALLPCNGFLNVACVLGKIADGTLADYGDPRTWPNYAVKQLTPEDFYKIEKQYDDWRAAHK